MKMISVGRFVKRERVTAEKMERLRMAAETGAAAAGSNSVLTTFLPGLGVASTKGGGNKWLVKPWMMYEDMHMPDPTRTGGSTTEPDVPWGLARPMYLDPADSDNPTTTNLYKRDDASATNEQTLYYPAGKNQNNGSGIATGGPPFFEDDIVWAVWNPQSGRREIISPPPTVVRYGKLDGDLEVGGTATVSLWWRTSDNAWAGFTETTGEDSGKNWETCYAPPFQTSTIAEGTWVYVESLNGVKTVLLAGCPS